ncbi:MAG: sugar transferase, partial [Acidimicrobiia bacterium]|nr:sugar transferase [Acidimicrobiia bacterium]
MSTAYRPYRGQRVLDLTICTLLAFPTFMLCLVCAAAVKATSRGPVFFRQERIGLGGHPFEIVKFRTMVDDDNPIVLDPSRITAVGRLLRHLSLDELPQFINVWRGEMSIVGPRPTLRYQVERYSEEQRLRLCVRPGLTGLAQVKGRKSLTWAERIEYDIEYVRSQSLLGDLRILATTLTILFTGAGGDGEVVGPAPHAAAGTTPPPEVFQPPAAP